MKKNILGILLVVAIIILVTVILIKNKNEVDAKVYIPDVNAQVVVATETIVKKKIDVKLEYLATLNAQKEAMLASTIAGIVTNVYFTDGQYVRKGKSLAQLDDEAIKANYYAALSRLQSDSTEYARYKKAAEMSPGSVSSNQLNQLKSKWQASKASLDNLSTQLKYTRLEAPFNGYINAKNIEVGNLISPGTIYARLTDMSVLKGIIYVSEDDISFFKQGQIVDVLTDDIKTTGKIVYVAYRANDAHKYEVHIAITNPNRRFRIGQYAKIINEVTSKQKGFVIPRTGLLGSIKNPQVYVVKNGIAKLVSIKVRSVNDKEISVMGQALQEGDTIVTSGHISLQDGAKVKINQ